MRWRAAVLALVVAASACDDSPTRPSTNPGAPTLSCPASIPATTTASSTVVTYATPTASGGQPPVTVACSPASGTTFSAGTTPVQCVATDNLGRTGSCQTAVVVTRLPTVRLTNYLAFGDSITAGEVTVPIPMSVPFDLSLSHPLVVVTSASYPTRLLDQLRARYATQAASLVMANEGKPGESVLDGVPRLAQLLANRPTEVLLLMHGYNDLLGFGTSAVPRTASAIDAMAREGRFRGARVFIALLTPPIPGRLRSIPLDAILAVNDRIRSIAAGESAVLVDLYSALSTDVNRYIGVDGLHPTEAGYQRMADEFFARVQADLEVK
jgi:lysophospholipase L1-like esterase